MLTDRRSFWTVCSFAEALQEDTKRSASDFNSCGQSAFYELLKGSDLMSKQLQVSKHVIVVLSHGDLRSIMTC